MQDFIREMRNAGRKQARIAADRARKTALARKQEYLGARVPKELRDKVIARAEALGIPVSILIRDILEEAFGGTAAASGEQQSTRSAVARAEGPRFPGVIGWEDIVLNRGMQCSSCRQRVSAGAVVMFGFAAPGEEHVILCDKCRVDA